MTYQECVQFLIGELPFFQKQGATAFNKNLDKTIALCSVLGNPQNRLEFIHVAGTNGKGSVCHGLASIFMEAGYNTGLFTSPHLFDFRERIRVNGKYISEEFVVNFLEGILPQIQEIKPSFFEVTFAMALAYFKHEGCEMVILETGMGGRLDSTNIVTPVLTIITTIGKDHQQYLGDTIELIAREKAGIIKSQIPCVVGNVPVSAQTVIQHQANLMHARIYTVFHLTDELRADRILALNGHPVQLNFALKGGYQLENLAIICQAFQLLASKYHLSPNNLQSGVANLIRNFPLLGRWQIISSSPKIICDVGHNEDGLRAILQQLKNESFDQLHIVFGMVNDKAPDAISLLPKDAKYHLCRANMPRAMEVSELEGHFKTMQFDRTTAYPNVISALMGATNESSPNDLILIIGSIFVVGEVLEQIEKGAITFAQ